MLAGAKTVAQVAGVEPTAAGDAQVGRDLDRAQAVAVGGMEVALGLDAVEFVPASQLDNEDPVFVGGLMLELDLAIAVTSAFAPLGIP